MRRFALLALGALAACAGGGDSDDGAIAATTLPAELVVCRSKRGDEHQETEIRTATRQALRNARRPDRVGQERDVRVHPDGRRIVFARERTIRDPSSREIFTATLDDSAPEARLTGDGSIDDGPCWSGDGARILWSSERGGAGRRLWSAHPDGSDLAIVFDDGAEQSEPDARGALIAFSRWDPQAPFQRRTIWFLDTTSGHAAPVTDGGIGTSANGIPGDGEPALASDGRTLLFTRSAGADRRQLFAVDLATGIAQPLGDGTSDDRRPRFGPNDATVFVARNCPANGLIGFPLYELAADGSDARAVFPDQRFEYPGFDVLPAAVVRATTSAPIAIDLSRADGTIALGGGSRGRLEFLDQEDGVVLAVTTARFDLRDVAGLRLRLPLPVPDPLRVAAIDIVVRAAVSRSDGDAVVLLTLENPGESRADTVLERPPGGTGLTSYALSTQCLANVSEGSVLILTVIADLPEGDPAELAVDSVTVAIRLRSER